MSKAKNRELFNEAIADAKAIKDMAIENAKKAIAESFTPQIHAMLATKLEEMEQEELDETELTNEEVESTNESEIDEAKKKAENEEEEEEESTNENVNLDELLAELNEDELNEEESLNEDLDEAKKAKDEKDEEEEEEIDLESMSSEDLEDFIKGVIKDMSASGELEGGGEEEEEEEEEVTIDEIMKSLGESEEVEEGGSTHKPVDKKAVDAKSTEYYEKAHEKVKEELGEAVAAINEMKKTLNDVNLLNAKLLYTNKIFKAKNLNESQKVKVLNSFDKAKTVSESKVVYNLLMESLGEKKTQIKEHRSSASAVISGSKGTKKPILENVDPQVTRFMKLAGL